MIRIPLSLLVLALLLAPAPCLSAEPNADQAKAIAEIEKLGGKVTLDETSPGKPVNVVFLPGNKLTDVGVAHLKVLTQLRSLDLGGTNITDAGVAHLSALTQLQEVDLSGTKITDAGVAHLKGLRQLWSLNLSWTNVTDAGLASLKGLASLRYLDIYETPSVSEKAVGDLQQALPKCWIFCGEPDPGPPADK